MRNPDDKLKANARCLLEKMMLRECLSSVEKFLKSARANVPRYVVRVIIMVSKEIKSYENCQAELARD